MSTEILTPTFEESVAGSHEHWRMYTAKDITKLIIYSFRFAQGDPILQDDIYNYIHANFGELYTPELVDEAIPDAVFAIKKIIGNTKLHKPILNSNPNFIEDEINNDIGFLKSGAGQPPNILSLARKIITRDRKFLVTGHVPDDNDVSDDRIYHRPRSTSGKRINTATDPYVSQFVYHGLMAQPTGSEEFDEMFREMVEALSESSSLSDIGDIDELVAVQIRHHPEQIDSLPAEVRENLDFSLV